MQLQRRSINDCYSAGQEWLRRTLEKEEFNLPDYERPTKITKPPKLKLSTTVAYVLGKEILREFIHP